MAAEESRKASKTLRRRNGRLRVGTRCETRIMVGAALRTCSFTARAGAGPVADDAHVTSAGSAAIPTRGKAFAASDVAIAPMSTAQLLSRDARLDGLRKGRRPSLARSLACAFDPGHPDGTGGARTLRKEGLDFPLPRARRRRCGTVDRAWQSSMASPIWLRSMASGGGARGSGTGSTRSTSTPAQLSGRAARATVEAMASRRCRHRLPAVAFRSCCRPTGCISRAMSPDSHSEPGAGDQLGCPLESQRRDLEV